MSTQDPDEQLADIREPLRWTLRRITERLAGELAQPTRVAPDWSPIEWRLARAVAVIHCVSPLLSGTLRWEGPAHWRDFLAGQKKHVVARQHRLQRLLDQIDARCREEGIAVVGLKGAALHSMGFYCAGERPMADLDLLVKAADTTRTGQLLQSLGFSESYATWKHGVFVPKVCNLHTGLGEHTDNYLKIELHARIAEKLPLRITDVTDSIYPPAPRPGLNAYPSNAALMTHLLIHAAGSMVFRSLRLLHLHDIALVCSRMAGSDWDELVQEGRNRNKQWWALPPLQLTARYYPDTVPAEVLAALSKHCPWTLRQNARHRRLSDVSLSYPWIEAFPGIAWSRSGAEILQYIGGRFWPDKESRRLRAKLVKTELAAAESQWCRLSQRQRALRWLTSRPLRVETLHAVRMALAQAH
ncbi:MAG TPA: nucleotidyltransferase family protein [Steroidobacteraceae bacterium]